ncbi:MAG: hypothetical protein NTU48_08725 [Legionellales bacterium]|nr:hypothetical protein [Legionellales bacterium]
MPPNNIQVNHVVQTTKQITRHHLTPKDTQTFQLVGIEEFRKLFHQHIRPLIEQYPGLAGNRHLENADLFWNHLLGHIDSTGQHGKNHKARYLTVESCNIILQNFEKFVSGIDFYHLPKGCLMAKNPATGVVDILHYSHHLHELQKAAPPRYLAINIDDPLDDEHPDLAHPFDGAQKAWYETLQAMRVLPNGRQTCSETALRAAFISFSHTVEELGCTFYPPAFSHKLL